IVALFAGGPAAAQVSGGLFRESTSVITEPGPNDSHAGYYYPELTSRETYGPRVSAMPDATRASRIGFITGLTQQQLSKPYPPPFALFAKGGEADKMIIVSLGDHGFRSLFQARGILAQLTAVARSTTLFRDLQVEDSFTFFDLAKMLGFTQITVSDGETFAHQVTLE
ncbi:MAG: hypothetical protein KIT81_16750, partial [Alphaproteobacteria bacterium]|nr:hypothetical protein [Alphaproteobacteria bacterium]